MTKLKFFIILLSFVITVKSELSYSPQFREYSSSYLEKYLENTENKISTTVNLPFYRSYILPIDTIYNSGYIPEERSLNLNLLRSREKLNNKYYVQNKMQIQLMAAKLTINNIPIQDEYIPDTSVTKVALALSDSFSTYAYFPTTKRKLLGLDFSIEPQTVISMSKRVPFDEDIDMENLSDSLKSITASDWEVSRFSRIEQTFKTIFSFRIGRSNEISPIIHTFNIQNYLLKRKIIPIPLTRFSRKNITEFISSTKSKNFEKKSFSDSLVQILKGSTDISDNKLRLVSPLDIKKILFPKKFEIYNENVLRIGFMANINIQNYNVRYQYPYDPFNIHTESEHTGKRDFDARFIPTVKYNFSKPVNRYLFFALKGTYAIDVSNDSTDDRTDTRWDASFLVIPVPNLKITISSENMPTSIIIPRDIPETFTLKLNTFIEDRVELNFSFRYNRKYKSEDFYNELYPFGSSYIYFSFGVSYKV